MHGAKDEPTSVQAGLARAVELAQRGRFEVEPNPVVGAVLLRDGEIVGEGWHRAFGDHHAEVEVLRRVGSVDARGATLCVTLEPCSTRGKTPACTDAILAAGIDRVVVGCVDPQVDHGGAGLDMLRAAGVAVDLADDPDCAALIEPFAAGLQRSRPWVVAKWAMSRDGAIAPAGGGPAAISSPESRTLLHRWRAHLDAIVVGVGTVIADDPQLTARGEAAPVRPGHRVILDPELRTPLGVRLMQTTGETCTWIYTTEDADEQPQQALENEGATVWRVPGDDEWLAGVLASLHLAGVCRLMVEGGATTLAGFFAAGLVDQVDVFQCPLDLGPGALPALPGRSLAGLSPEQLAEALGLEQTRVLTVGPDRLLRGYVSRRG